MSVVTSPSFRVQNDIVVDNLQVESVSGTYALRAIPYIMPNSATVLTPQQIAGYIIVNPAASTVTTIALPTATALMQAYPNVPANFAVEFIIINASTGGTLTVTPGTGVTFIQDSAATPANLVIISTGGGASTSSNRRTFNLRFNQTATPTITVY